MSLHQFVDGHSHKDPSSQEGPCLRWQWGWMDEDKALRQQTHKVANEKQAGGYEKVPAPSHFVPPQVVGVGYEG